MAWRKKRFTRRGSRSKRRVNWLATQGASQSTFTAIGKYFLPLGQVNNPLVGEYSRLANAQDVITYMRIVGQLRVALYLDTLFTNISGEDTVVSYGLCLVKGEYDGAGNWTVNVADIPNPFNGEDDPDKWLVKRDIIMSPTNALAYTVGVANVSGENYTEETFGAQDRPLLMGTDQLGPHYSELDIKPKRRALFEEKLGIIIGIQQIPTGYTIFVNEHLRVLTAKWG